MGGLQSTYSTTNEIVVKILNELAEHTDSEHGLSVAELSRRVDATEKTVRNHLQMLQMQRPMGRRVSRLYPSDLERAESADACCGWYMEPLLDAAQLRLLGDGLMLSRIDESHAADAYQILRKLAGYAGEHAGRLTNMSVPRHYNREFLSNVENLDMAISAGRVVTLGMCYYNADGELVMKTDADTGRPKNMLSIPIRWCTKTANII